MLEAELEAERRNHEFEIEELQKASRKMRQKHVEVGLKNMIRFRLKAF